MNKIYNLNPAFYFKLWNPSFQTDKKSPLDLQRSLKKALSGGYHILLFDENILKDRNLTAFFNKTLDKGLQPAIQITSQSFKENTKLLLTLKDKYKESLFLNIVFDNIKQLPLQNIKTFFPQILLTYVVTKKNKHIVYKEQLTTDFLKKTELCFPYKESFFDLFLTPRQVYKFIKKQGVVQTYQKEVYDTRIAQDMELEPITQAFAKKQISQNNNILFSVIIPSYNSKETLLNTLKHLALQNYPKDKYEIIVVDDGSSDNTRQALRDFINKYSLNITALHFPRVVERKPGDARFRAGLARNLGVKHSQGTVLAFLDADILTPPSYFKQLEEEHKKADVVLLKRYHLKSKAPVENWTFDKEDIKQWSYIKENSYWGKFYDKGFDKVQAPWKYICTYGLSLRTKDFQSVGAFGKNFIFYGFEDTDLGWRLFKKNKKFLLSSLEVYHQAPAKNREEHKQNPLSQHNLLAKTAKIFFYRHLDPSIYEEMQTYMYQQRGFTYFFPFLKKKQTLSFK